MVCMVMEGCVDVSVWTNVCVLVWNIIVFEECLCWPKCGGGGGGRYEIYDVTGAQDPSPGILTSSSL